jgi:hypothetical protein
MLWLTEVDGRKVAEDRSTTWNTGQKVVQLREKMGLSHPAKVEYDVTIQVDDMKDIFSVLRWNTTQKWDCPIMQKWASGRWSIRKSIHLWYNLFFWCMGKAPIFLTSKDILVISLDTPYNP